MIPHEEGASGAGSRTEDEIMSASLEQGALGPENKPSETVTILYTNYRGETAPRRITPIAREWFGSSDWHPEPQWLFTAFDMDKEVFRDFARSGVKAWGQAAVDAALSASAPASGAETKTAGQAAHREFYGSGLIFGFDRLPEGLQQAWERAAAAAIQYAALASRADGAGVTAGEDVKRFARAVLHGDDEHRAWLTEAAECFVAGRPLPEPRGKGTQASPAPAAGQAGAVPDSLRALSEDETKRIVREGVAKLWDAEKAPSSAAMIRAGKWDDIDPVRSAIQGGLLLRDALLASHPAGQSAGSGAGTVGLHWKLDDETKEYLRALDTATVHPGDPRLNTMVGPAGPALGLDGYGSQARPLKPVPDSTRTGAAETEDALASAIEERWTALIGPAYEGGWVGWKRRDLCREFAKAALAARPEAPSDAGWSRTGSSRLPIGFGPGEWEWFRVADAALRFFPAGFNPNSGRYEGLVIGSPTPPSDPAPSGQAEG